MAEQQVQEQMEQMTLQRNKVRSFLKQVHSQLQQLNVSDFGMLEDVFYDAPENLTPNYVDGLRLTKSKRALKVKSSVDTMMKIFVQVNREVVDAQKASYRHAVAKRRLATVSVCKRDGLEERQRERQSKRARREELSTVVRPSLAALEGQASDDEDPFEELDFS